MTRRVRVGAVAYLNTRPLVFGFDQGVGADRIELSYDVPSTLADRLARGDIDVGLIPSVELARIPDLEIVPGLSIASRGAARSVLLACRRPPERVRHVALDPESRTSNALARILFDRVWNASPTWSMGPVELDRALDAHDAVVRIGDKALFEPLPEGTLAIDLGEAWSGCFGLPFVWAVWACRRGVLDRGLYELFHESRRRGRRVVDLIAEDYTWRGRRDPGLAKTYLTEHMRYRLGSSEIRGLERFLDEAARVGAIDRRPDVRLGLVDGSSCHRPAQAGDAVATTHRCGGRR